VGAAAQARRFAAPDGSRGHARRVGGAQLKLRVTDGLGAHLAAIAFGAFDTARGPALDAHGGARFHLAGRLEINNWQGRQSAQLRLEDASPATSGVPR